MILRVNHKSSHSVLNSDVIDKAIIKDWPWMRISPHNRISTKYQKCRGRDPRGCITILIQRKGGMLYQNTCDTWLLIPRPLRTFGKQPGPTGVTPNMLLLLLFAQDSIHDISNAKQMADKTNPYWENRPGCSLPLDSCKRNNRLS